MDRIACDSPTIDLGGTVRADSVPNSLAKARAVMPALGITRLANVTGLDHVGVPTWMAVRPLALSLSVSQGKGLTHTISRRFPRSWSASRFTTPSTWSGSLRSLRAAAETASHVHPLLLPIRPDVTIDGATAEWVAGHRLGDGRVRWVPRDCIEIDASHNESATGFSSVLRTDSLPAIRTTRQYCTPSARSSSATSRHSGTRAGNFRSTHVRAGCASIRLPTSTADGFWIDADRQDWTSPRGTRRGMCRCRALPALYSIAMQDVLPATGFGIGLSSLSTNCLVARDHRSPAEPVDVHRRGTRRCLLVLVSGRPRADDEAGRIWGEAEVAEAACLDFEGVPEAPPMMSIEALLKWVLEMLAGVGFDEAMTSWTLRRRRSRFRWSM